MDSPLVSAADGSGTARYQRDPQLFRALAQRSAVLHARLLKEWPRLSAEYRSQESRFTSPALWRETFRASVDNPLSRR